MDESTLMVKVKPIPGWGSEHVSIDDLIRIRASYPIQENWRGWWQNVHQGHLRLVESEDELKAIGFPSAWHTYTVEHWKYLGWPEKLPTIPVDQLKQLPLF